MKVQIKSHIFIFFILLGNYIWAQNIDYKFPLNKIGIKIKKPKNYFLLTPENVKDLKVKLYSLIDICNDSKLALDNAINNPNYQVLINENNYNEVTTFIRFPKSPVGKEIPESMQKKSKNIVIHSKIQRLKL